MLASGHAALGGWRRLARTLVIFVAASITAGVGGGCTAGEAEGPASTSGRSAEPASSRWDGPPKPREDGTLAVAEFNGYVERADAAWSRSPLLWAITFLRLEGQQAAKVSVDVETSPEGGQEALVSATLDGLLDDSVRGVRRFLTVHRQPDGSWRLRSARQQQRCWPNRGHRDFSTAPCV
jgi:hypothetical protein